MEQRARILYHHLHDGSYSLPETCLPSAHWRRSGGTLWAANRFVPAVTDVHGRSLTLAAGPIFADEAQCRYFSLTCGTSDILLPVPLLDGQGLRSTKLRQDSFL